MGLIRECIIELFEIAARDYFLAVAILEKGNYKISFDELDFHLGSRNKDIHPFIERALDSVDESTLNKNLLIKKIKEPVQGRANVCIYLLLKYKKSEVTLSDIFLCDKTSSWDKNTELISEISGKINLSNENFNELIVAYSTGNSSKRNLAKEMLMRLPKSEIDFNYVNKNRLKTFDRAGCVCRLLLIKYFSEELSDSDLLTMYRKDYSNDVSAYIELWMARVKKSLIPKHFWIECSMSNHSEIKELAHIFLHNYGLSAPQKSEMQIFFENHAS